MRDIQAYFNEKAQKTGGKLSGQTLRKHNVVIHGALEDAVRNNIIAVNYADRVILPKQREYHGKFYTKEQVLKLFDAVRGTPIEGIVMLTVYYGLRRSEAVGLKWSAIVFEKQTVSIQNTVVQFNTVLEKETTKTKSSRRTYPMSPEIVNILLKIKSRQDEMKKTLGAGYHDNGYVFIWDDGTFFRPDYITSKFQIV